MPQYARWIAALGLCGLLTAWVGLGVLLLRSEQDGPAALLAQATGVGAVLALVCGLLHPRRSWTLGLVVGGGVFLGLFVLG